MQKGKLIKFTGLSGSGKTTIGKAVFEKYKKDNSNTVFIDGDSFRKVIGDILGYTTEDRIKVSWQIARMCELLISQGINVVCATISLYEEIHKYNRENIENLYLIYVDCNIEELIKRDQKGIYSASKDSKGNVVGLDLKYDKPEKCELIIDNSEKNDLEFKVNQVLELINEK